MKLEALLLCGTALTSVVGGALAGEDSTHRLHGVGPAWYEVKDGLRKLAADAPDQPARTNQAASGSVNESHAARSPSRRDSKDRDAQEKDPARPNSAM